MGDYMVLVVNRKPGVSFQMVQAKVNLSKDWFRINENSWVVFTTADTDRWHARMIDLVNPGGNYFICKLDLSKRYGWMKKEFWTWLKKPR